MTSRFERGKLGVGSVLALDAIGKQDTYLYNENLKDSRWDPSYTQTTNFAISQRSVTLPGTNFINREVKVELSPKSCGDMLSNMHLSCSLPALPAGNVYTDQIGRAIISQIDFSIDGQVIESLNDDWYILRDQLFLDADEKNAMAQAINGGYSEGTLSTQTNTPQIDMIIPLDFFFCRRHSRYKKHRERLDRPHFPTCALYNQKIFINFKFKPWAWFSNSISDQRIGNITMNTPLVIYTSSTSNSLATGDTNVYVTDDISFWPNAGGSITIDNEQMTYGIKNGSFLSGLVRPNRTTHSNGAPITLTSTSGFTYTSNIVMYPVSNCVPGMYMYGIPTLSGSPAVINSIDSANNILNITYNNLVPTSQTYPLAFSFSKVTRTISIPSTFISQSDHFTFMFDSSTGVFPGMEVGGLDLVGGPLYIKGIPTVVSNNINQFDATIVSVVGSTVTFTINQAVPYLTTGTTYVNFPNGIFATLTNVNGTSLTGTVTAGNPSLLSNIKQFSASNVRVSGSTVTFQISGTVSYLTTTGTTRVNFLNGVFATLTIVDGANLTATITSGNPGSLTSVMQGEFILLYNGKVEIDSPPIVGNRVTLAFPLQQPVIIAYGGSMSVTFADNIQKVVRAIFNSPIDLTKTSNVVTINSTLDIRVGQLVTGMPAIAGSAYVTAINGSQYTITYPVQNQCTVGFPFIDTDSNISVSGDITFWPDYNGSININSENMLYSQKIINTLVGVARSNNMQGFNKTGSNVSVMSLVSEAGNNLATTTTSVTNIQTVVTLSGNVYTWPPTGVVQLGVSEVCPYTLNGQIITLTRVLPATTYPLGTNVLVQNTFTLVSTLQASIGRTDTLITLTSTFPLASGTVLIEKSEVCEYTGKSGQNITIARGGYPRNHPAFSNVLYQNVYTISTLNTNMTPASNSFTITAQPFTIRNWPTNNSFVVVDNETISYGIRQGNVFSNCFSRALTFSTHFVGESILNISALEFPISIQNLTDFISPPKLLIEEIQLSDSERQYTKSIPRRLVVNHVQRQPPLYFEQGTNGQITIGIGASFPVTFLCWFIRRGAFETLTRYVDSRYSYGYTTKYVNSTSTPISFFNGVKLNYLDLIESAQITLSGNSILNQAGGGGIYFSMKQPFDHSLSIPTKSVYLYAFGLNPKEYNQGGFMDFSPLNASSTTLSLAFKPQYAAEIAQAFSLYLFYYGYTILEVKDGFGRLVFV